MQFFETTLRLILALVFFIPSLLIAQGPRIDYFFNPATELSWASCEIYMEGGSKQKISFTPVISSRSSPYGTEQYNRNIQLEGPIVFVGNGIGAFQKENEDNEENVDVKGKIIMFCFDFPDSINAELEKSYDLKSRIISAISKHVAGIIFFSFQQKTPFLAIRDTLLAIDNEVPMIAINKETAEDILLSAGRDPMVIFEKWRNGILPKSEQLITKIKININGKFNTLESEFFTIKYRSESIPEMQVKSLLDINDQSVKFIINLFRRINPRWEKNLTVYFADYDSKLFFTRHWGYGWSNSNGSFIVFDKELPGFGVAVHENTHSLFKLNWGGNNSFINEGIAKYAEAMATQKDQNHIRTAGFLREDRLYRLEEMQKFNIGRNEDETEVGYPAAGSFVQFIIQKYGLEKFLEKFELADQWERVYNISLVELERKWVEWIAGNFEVDSRHVEKHFKKNPRP